MSRDSEVREAIEALQGWNSGTLAMDCVRRAEVLAILDHSSEAAPTDGMTPLMEAYRRGYIDGENATHTRRQAMMTCSHDDVQAERAYDERPEGTNPLGIVGTCLDCGSPMRLSGEPDEDGHPTWELDYTPDELFTILHQSGEMA